MSGSITNQLLAQQDKIKCKTNLSPTQVANIEAKKKRTAWLNAVADEVNAPARTRAARAAYVDFIPANMASSDSALTTTTTTGDLELENFKNLYDSYKENLLTQKNFLESQKNFYNSSDLIYDELNKQSESSNQNLSKIQNSINMNYRKTFYIDNQINSNISSGRLIMVAALRASIIVILYNMYLNKNWKSFKLWFLIIFLYFITTANFIRLILLLNNLNKSIDNTISNSISNNLDKEAKIEQYQFKHSE